MTDLTQHFCINLGGMSLIGTLHFTQAVFLSFGLRSASKRQRTSYLNTKHWVVALPTTPWENNETAVTPCLNSCSQSDHHVLLASTNQSRTGGIQHRVKFVILWIPSKVCEFVLEGLQTGPQKVVGEVVRQMFRPRLSRRRGCRRYSRCHRG